MRYSRLLAVKSTSLFTPKPVSEDNGGSKLWHLAWKEITHLSLSISGCSEDETLVSMKRLHHLQNIWITLREPAIEGFKRI